VFDIGWSEMAVILLVALVVIGPRDLPRVARSVGRWVAKGRAMAREFQTALEDMAREAELDKVKSEIEKVGRTDLSKSIEKTIDPTGELGKAFDPKAKSRPKTDNKIAKPVAGSKDAAAKNVAPAAAGPGASNAGPANGAAEEAAPAPPVEAAAAPPADPAPAVGGQEGAPSGRSRAKGAERETVPADPS
jgi:sec-independent protein translocase protein TatB